MAGKIRRDDVLDRGAEEDREEHGEGDHEGQPGQEPLPERAVAQGRPLLLQPGPEGGLARDPALHLALDRLEIADQLLRVRVAVLGPLAEAAGHDPLERGGEVRPEGRHRPRLLEGDRVERVEGGRAREGQLARHHLVEDDAEREDVAPVVHRLPAGLLRAHVAERAEDEAGLGLGERLHVGDALGGLGSRRLEELGEAEVEDLGMAVRGHDDVLGLDVPVDDARLVRLLEAAPDLGGDLEGAEEVELAALDEGLHRLALDELHGDEEALGPLVHVVHLGDRGVGHRGRRARLLEEPALPVLVASELGRKDLERHRTSQAGVAGPVHDAHATLPEQLFDLVVLDGLADHRHRW